MTPSSWSRALICAFAVTALLGAGVAAARMPDQNTLFGQQLGVVVTPSPPPPFPLRLADGRETSFDAYRGRVVLATFWATWCGVCAQELPELAQLQRRVGGAVTILPVSLDSGEAFPQIARFYRRRGVSGLPQVLDVAQQNANYAQIGMTPTTFVINKRGMVVGVLQGAADWGSAEALAYLRGLAAE